MKIASVNILNIKKYFWVLIMSSIILERHKMIEVATRKSVWLIFFMTSVVHYKMHRNSLSLFDISGLIRLFRQAERSPTPWSSKKSSIFAPIVAATSSSATASPAGESKNTSAKPVGDTAAWTHSSLIRRKCAIRCSTRIWSAPASVAWSALLASTAWPSPAG